MPRAPCTIVWAAQNASHRLRRHFLAIGDLLLSRYAHQFRDPQLWPRRDSGKAFPGHQRPHNSVSLAAQEMRQPER